MHSILIGNLFSFAAACFTGASSLAKKKKNIYLLQGGQCLLLAIANIFFGSYAGLTTLALCCIRNILIAYDAFPMKLCIPYLFVLTGFGMYCNNRGLVGLIPVFATILYTVVSCIAENEKPIKINILTNLIFWMIYEFFVLDFSSLAADSICLILTVYALIRIRK